MTGTVYKIPSFIGRHSIYNFNCIYLDETICWGLVISPTHYNDVIMSSLASQITSLANVYTTVYSGADQRKHQSSASLAFVWGNPPVTGEFPAQIASYAENVSIWWRHHGNNLLWSGDFTHSDARRDEHHRFTRHTVLDNSISPIARIVRNDHRATLFVGRSCPPNLWFENSGNKHFSVSNSWSLHTPCALDFERLSAKWLSCSIIYYFQVPNSESNFYQQSHFDPLRRKYLSKIMWETQLHLFEI